MMEKDELIAKQQLEIENLKQRVSELDEALRNIHSSIVCIGGPLNDNQKGYTHSQLSDFGYIVDQVEAVIDW
jgi:phosphopantetheine adenylyltransferase